MFTQLHADKACSPALHDFLDLIEESMLIIESPGRKRATCEAVRRKLSQIEARCTVDDDYCIKPSPPIRIRHKSKPKPVPFKFNDISQHRMSRYNTRFRSIQDIRTIEPLSRLIQRRRGRKQIRPGVIRKESLPDSIPKLLY
jgi:hypothetical protein